MVYESMGDIWLTATRDGGSTWWPEERLNTRQGYASNPTLSNIIYYNYQACGAVSWAETNQSGVAELHFQSFRVFTGGGYTPHVVWYGWNGSGDRSSSNHRTMAEMGLAGVFPRAGARPVVILQSQGSLLVMGCAFEASGSGIWTTDHSLDLASGNDLANSTPGFFFTINRFDLYK
jgi:hypothetical protein